MKRTDEMKLGEDLRGYCDCNQGRLPCTCKDPLAELAAASARSYREFTNNQYHSAILAAKLAPSEPNREAERPEIQMVGTSDPIERFSVAAQLQLMKALAILGWAAFFLELLRV